MDPVLTQNQNQIQSTPLKEKEPGGISKTAEVEHITSEVEVPPEVERAGVMKYAETIELPPDVKKLGVTHAGPSVPVTTATTALPQVSLPISDTQVVSGLHAQVISALRWLAEWCLKKLKKAHLALKVVHGKVMRIKS